MSNVSLIDGHIDNAEHCVCCGAVIPEGRQVCIICGLKTNYKQSTAEKEELKTLKATAVKEFTEKVKEFMHNKFKALDEYEFEYITERDIDKLLKEMVGENND